MHVACDNAVSLYDNIAISHTDRKNETLNEQLMILQKFIQLEVHRGTMLLFLGSLLVTELQLVPAMV